MSNSDPIDKKDPEYLRQRQVEYQREYRKREAERRDNAKINAQVVQQVPIVIQQHNTTIQELQAEVSKLHDQNISLANDNRELKELHERQIDQLVKQHQQQMTDLMVSKQNEFNQVLFERDNLNILLQNNAKLGKMYESFVRHISSIIPNLESYFTTWYNNYAQAQAQQ